MLRTFELSRMTNQNGPGIRTLVHFKGCPLRCIWCSTPESQRRELELQFKQAKCIGDGSCMEVCQAGAIKREPESGAIEINRKNCTECFSCVEACYAKAWNQCGFDWNVETLLQEICKDEVFYRTSGGGVTFSGGEPLMYVEEDMVQLYRMLRERNVSIGVDTTGYVAWENIEKLLPYIDFFLWDIKSMDCDKHKKYTGVGNNLILENLKKVEERAHLYNTKVIIRCVQIPGMTDDNENLNATCEFVKKLQCVQRIDLVNFHHYGKKRYEALGRIYPMEGKQPLSIEELKEKQKLVESYKIICCINS